MVDDFPSFGEFRRRPGTVLAWRVRYGSQAPGWVAQAAKDGLLWWRMGKGNALSVQMLSGGVVSVPAGDWLAQTPGNTLDLYPIADAVFRERYEPIPDATPEGDRGAGSSVGPVRP